jgi:hypothetical protein
MSAVPNIFERLARNDNGKILRTSEDNYLDHPAGPRKACATLSDAPTRQSTAGCTNGTLTFVALTLRSATEIAKAL